MNMMTNMFILAACGASVCEEGIDKVVPIAGFILRIIQFAAPVLLIIWGSIDMIKSIIAGKEDDIKKNQKTLVKRAIAAVILFLVPFFVSVVLGLIGTDSWKDCWNACKNEDISNLVQ